MVSGPQIPDNLKPALDRLFKTDQEAVRLGLKYDPRHIEFQYGVWSVPVASGIAPANGYELSRAIHHVQEVAERQTNLPISFFLMTQFPQN